MRVGYPANLSAELVARFPQGVQLVPIPSHPEDLYEVDFWIPPPAAALGQRIWPQLRGVRIAQSLMAGTEWLTALVGPAVTVCNAQGAHNISTAEWTLSAILAMLKYFPLYHELQQAADWKHRNRASALYSAIHRDDRPQFPPIMLEELHGKRVLLVGYGAIGKHIESLLAPFGVALTRVARSARTQPPVHAVSELHTLLPQAEILILILPHTPDSHGLIGEREIALLPQGALLVNAARGPVVDTGALVAALNQGRIRAALDVTDPEPLPPEHPLWQCPNLFITPHVAGSTPQFTHRSVQIAIDQLHRMLNGQPLINVVQQGTLHCSL